MNFIGYRSDALGAAVALVNEVGLVSEAGVDRAGDATAEDSGFVTFGAKGSAFRHSPAKPHSGGMNSYLNNRRKHAR